MNLNFFSVVLCFFCYQFLYAREVEKLDSLSYSKNHYISIGYNNILFTPLKFNGRELLKSRLSYSPELNFGHIYDFSKLFMVSSRLNFGKNSFNFGYNFETPENSILRNAQIENVQFWRYESEMGYNLNTDVMIFLKIAQNQNFFSVGAGPRFYTFFRNYLDFTYKDIYLLNNQNENHQLFAGNLNNDNLSTYNFALNVDINYTKKIKNNLLLKMSFLYSKSFTKRLEGAYQFFEIGNDNVYNWHQIISFYSFSLELIFPTKLKDYKN